MSFDSHNIIFEDNHLLVVKKPCNIPVQADISRDEDLLNILKKYIKIKYDKPGNVFLGLVHRLDRPVGGVMVFAKTSKSASRLSEQIRNRSFKKTYIAVVNGCPLKKEGILSDYLYKDKRTNIVHISDKNNKNAKLAELYYEVLQTNEKYSLIKIDLKTGRSHQIRVQFANIGHPLYGDQKYGKQISKSGQQIALWSYEIELVHPTKKECMTFKCKPPEVYPWNEISI